MSKLRLALMLALAAAACGDDTREPPVLVRTDVATSAECADGGSVVRAGADHDSDGTLDDDEVVSTTPVCAASPGAPEAAVLVRIDPVPVGQGCADGGTAVRSGRDTDRDGVLDDAEVTKTDTVCGPRLLGRMEAAPIGPGCPAGGIAFLAGRDRDGDGTLDADEVEQRASECGDVLHRDLDIMSDAEVALLATLREVDGAVRVGGGSTVTRLELPALTHVSGPLSIESAPSLQVVNLPGLQSVGTRARWSPEVRIYANPVLTQATVRVADCGDRVASVDDNPALKILELSCSGARTIHARYNDALEEFIFSARRASWIYLLENDALRSVQLQTERLVGLTIDGGVLDTLDLARVGLGLDYLRVTAPLTSLALRKVNGFDLEELNLRKTKLRTLDIAAVTWLMLANNPELVSVHGHDIGALTATDNAVLGRVDLDGVLPKSAGLSGNPKLTEAPWLSRFTGAGLRIAGSPDLVTPERMVLVGDGAAVEIADVRTLEHLEVRARELYSLRVEASAVTTIDVRAASLTSYELGSIALVANPALTSAHVEIDQVRMASATPDFELSIKQNPLLADLQVGVPTEGNRVEIVDNGALSHCTANAILASIVAAHEVQRGNDDAPICPP